MKNLKQTIFVFVLFIGLAVSVPAQSDDQKNPRPPKDVPVRDPVKKPPKGNNPPKDDKPKKPGMSFYLVSADRQGDTA